MPRFLSTGFARHNPAQRPSVSLSKWLHRPTATTCRPAVAFRPRRPATGSMGQLSPTPKPEPGSDGTGPDNHGMHPDFGHRQVAKRHPGQGPAPQVNESTTWPERPAGWPSVAVAVPAAGTSATTRAVIQPRSQPLQKSKSTGERGRGRRRRDRSFWLRVLCSFLARSGIG